MNKFLTLPLCPLFVLLILSCSETRQTDSTGPVVVEVKAPKVDDTALKYSVNTDRSVIRWKGTKMLRTAGHEGTVDVKEGRLLFKHDELVGGRVTADVNSIKIGISKTYDEETMRNLSNYLKRREFNVEEFPLAHFEITKAEPMQGDSLRVWGNMTIKDVTRNISIPATVNDLDKDTRLFRTNFRLERASWNIGVDGNLLEKNLVDKDFELSISLVVERKE